MTSPAPGDAPEFVLAQRFREKAEALRRHAALIQDVLLPRTSLDADDVSPEEGMLDS